MLSTKQLRQLGATIDRITSTLAGHDIQVRSLDLPGLPDGVWDDLAAMSYTISDEVDGLDPERYRELDFEEYHLNPEPDEYDEEENEEHTERYY
jgi:hypothetical protein